MRSDVITVNVYRRMSSAMPWCPAETVATSRGAHAEPVIVAGSFRNSVRSDVITADVVPTR